MTMAENTNDGVACRHCRTPMELLKVKKFPGGWPILLIVAGVFCSLFFVGVIIGIPMMLLGIYMAMAGETINHCSNCGNYYRVLINKP